MVGDQPDRIFDAFARFVVTTRLPILSSPLLIAPRPTALLRAG
jgi:hypothetical protein